MPTPALVILIVVLSLLALVGLWLFLIAPRARKEAMRPFMRPFAHRGLWNEELPENSLAAFRHAAEEGFAIELDVQLSHDNTVMVFHDYTLDRMCGAPCKLSDLTVAELKKLCLADTNERIPTLREVLETVNGRVPLLIELKGEGTDTSLVPRVLAELSKYEGDYCIESFNPLLLRAVKRLDDSVVRGLLSSDFTKNKKKNSDPIFNFFLSQLLFTCVCRPAFHAFDGRYPNRRALKVGIRYFGAAPVVYTIKNEVDYDRFLDAGVAPIFEGFIPKRREVSRK